MAFTGVGYAQDTSDEGASSTEYVTVTGTRIPRRDYSSDSPISTVAGDAMQTTGSVTPEQLLNTLPQVVPSVTTTSNNPGAGGAATIDLRGLGTNRNLVLINGRRGMPSFSSGEVDLNTIPVAMIDRIEIITGGATAVYGPDAVAGVVNIILKDNFEGVSVDLQFGRSEHGDADEVAASATVGGNFEGGKGNAAVSYDYSHRQEVFKGRRTFTAQATSGTSFFPSGTYRPVAPSPANPVLSDNRIPDATWDAYFGAASHGGAPTTNQSASSVIGFNADGTLYTVGTAGSTTSQVYNYRGPGGDQALFFCGGGNALVDGTCDTFSFNFEPYNKLILPLERHTLMGRADYEFTDDMKAYLEVSFTNYNADQELAPTPAPTSAVTNPVTGLSCGGNYCAPVSYAALHAPDFSAALATRIVGRDSTTAGLSGTGPTEDFTFRRRFMEAGGRLSHNVNDLFNVVVGATGDLPGGFTWDVYAAIGRLDNLETQFGNVSNSAVENLLYGTGAADDADCDQTVFNIFGRDSIPGACIDNITRVTKNSTTLEQHIVEGSLTGILGHMPAGDIRFALGAQYREQDFDFIPDELAASGDISGFNAQQRIHGSVDNADVFAEVNIPIVANEPMFEDLDITLGYRATFHSGVGTIHTYKAEGNWLLGEGFRLRGSYQRAVRAPNIFELFAPSFQDNPPLLDPCSGGLGADISAPVFTICQQQGVATPTTYIQPNSQITALAGGNPNLHEETADTYTFGMTYQSESESPWLEGLSVSLDYYHIEISGPIGVDAGSILYNCFYFNDGSLNADPNCQNIIRTGPDITYIIAFLTNEVSQEVSGVDLQVNWAFDLDHMGMTDAGTLTFSFVGSWLEQWKEQTGALSPVFDYAGTIGESIGSALPEYKWSLTTTWDIDDFSFAVRVNFIDQMSHSQLLVLGPGATIGGIPVTGVDEVYYWDFFSSWNVTDWWTLRAGVLNIENRDPEIYFPSIQDNTDPSTYDVVGRRYFIGTNFRF